MSENDHRARLAEKLFPIVAGLVRRKFEAVLAEGLSEECVEVGACALLHAKEAAPLYGIDPETLLNAGQGERLVEAIEADPTAAARIDKEALFEAARADGRFERAAQEVREVGLVSIDELEPEINETAGRQTAVVIDAWRRLLTEAADTNDGTLEANRLDEAMLPVGVDDDAVMAAIVSNAIVNDLSILLLEEREEEVLLEDEFREVLARFAATLAPGETLPSEMLALLAEDGVWLR